MRLVRRLLVLISLFFWQGGFTFYAAVVVPVGSEVLGSHRAQGRVTRPVTNYLNLAGLAALAPLAWDAAQSRRSCLRWACWIGMAATLGALAFLHQQLDRLLDQDPIGNPDWLSFAAKHRWYLWISTVQWAFAAIYLVQTLRIWREEDRTAVS